jgi:hypothetical protein
MNISELVAGKLPEIKKLLFNEEPVAEAFEDAKLVDGTIVRYEVLEVGANLSVIGEDGEVVAAPDGTHELESGVIVRTEGGVIVEVMEPEAAPEEVEEEAKEEKEEEMAAEETTEEVPAFDADKFKEDILGAVSNLVKSEIDAAAFASAKKVDEVTEAVSLVTDIVEKMAATPKEAPTKKVANPFSKGTSGEDLVEKMRKALNK